MNCSSLASVTIPHSVKEIGGDAFAWCSSLTSVVIGNAVKEIGIFSFRGCLSLTEIISLNPTPPGTFISFDYVPTSTCVLKVPAEAVESYKAADEWSEFQNVVGLTDEEYEQYMKLTPVNSPLASTPAAGKIYNLDGQTVDEGYKGIVIRNGKKMLRR